MLAKGKGRITIEEFRKIFNLPKDAEIIGIDMSRGVIEFSMLSADEVEKKFFKVEDIEGLRRFRLVEEKPKSFGEVMDDDIAKQEFTEKVIKAFYDEWDKNADKEFISNQNGFGFDEAMKALLDGKKVSRSIWGGYWQIRDTTEFGNIIVAVLKDGGTAVAQPYMEDLMAFDWQIVE